MCVCVSWHVCLACFLSLIPVVFRLFGIHRAGPILTAGEVHPAVA